MTVAHAGMVFVLPNVVMLMIALLNPRFQWSETITVKLVLAIYGGIMMCISAFWAFGIYLSAAPQTPTFSVAIPMALAGLNFGGFMLAHHLERRR